MFFPEDRTHRTRTTHGPCSVLHVVLLVGEYGSNVASAEDKLCHPVYYTCGHLVAEAVLAA